MAKADILDAVAMLKADHRKVEALFEAFESARRGTQKKRLAAQICLELSVHTKLEEDVFYPACEAASGVDDDLLKEAHVEHDGAKVLIAEIEAGAPDEEFYDAKVKVLSELIKHHVKEEEKRSEGLFAQARAAGLDMDALAAEMQREKRLLTATYKKDGLPVPKAMTYRATQVGAVAT